MTKRKLNWLSNININLYEDDMLPHFFGEYLLDEEVWMEAGMYMSEYITTMPDIMEDDELVEIVDEFIWRMIK